MNDLLRVCRSLILVFIVCVISANAQGIDHKIYMVKAANKEIESGYEYQLLDQRDTLFIKIKQSGDFGRVSYTYYEVKDKLPDGKYEVYVENQLTREAYYQNGLKEGKWIEYWDSGEKEVVRYSKGKIKGAKEYYKNGSIKQKGFFRNNNIIRRNSYSESGRITIKEYFKENKQYRVKMYNGKGKVFEDKMLN